MISEEEKTQIKDAWKAISVSMQGFKPRAAQRHMIAQVAKTLCKETEHRISMLEAPTGTGKTFAYLIGAIPAIKREVPIVIATSTTTLQEQVFNKDIPAFMRHTETNFTYALAKGRGRYVCPKRLENAGSLRVSRGAFEVVSQMVALYNTGTWDGDRDHWEEEMNEEVWTKICSDKQDCPGSKCSAYEGCPYYTERKKLDNAQVIITNHSLLLSDISLGGGKILPDPAECYYIIDEAHDFSDQAVRSFQRNFTIPRFIDAITEGAESVEKELHTIRDTKHEKSFKGLVTQVGKVVDSLASLHQLLLNRFSGIDPAGLPDNEPICRFKLGRIPDVLFNELTRLQADVSAAMIKADDVDSFSDAYEDNNALMTGLSATTEQIAYLQECLSQWIGAESGNGQAPIAKWITARSLNNVLSFQMYSSPCEVGSYLQERLWERCLGAVLTSATLTALGTFDFVCAKNGLGRADSINTMRLPAVYDYQNQGVLNVPKMKFDPKQAEDHTSEVIDAMPDLLRKYRGSLVLFSAHKQMNAVYDALPASLQACILKQGSMPPRVLLDMHRKHIDAGKVSILFGLASFAEGLDLPGSYCEHVIIAKIPFRVPNEPLLKTHHEWIESKGQSPFSVLELPIVSVRLLQAAGRLIRTETDTGEITILDNRLSKKSYGKSLINALPEFSRRVA